MKALVFDGELKLVDMEPPVRKPGEALIRVSRAGICNTDHEIVKGYVPGFKGIPGHEFFGYVEAADIPALAGKRVTGEINLACGSCEYCRAGLDRHCPERAVLGIISRDGAFAEYMCLPERNVVAVPDEIPNSSAVFIEPLAAALEILEQTSICETYQVLLIGDGKLAQLIARVLKFAGGRLLAVGKHENKLAMMKALGADVCMLQDFEGGRYDVVIEASGSPSGFELGLDSVKPRGTLVLKSTYAKKIRWDPARLVVNEISLVGSRCGRFSTAIEFLLREKPDLSCLIEKEVPLARALEAFSLSEQKQRLKVVLAMD